MYKLSDIVYAVARRMPTQEDAKKYRKIVEQSGARELKIDGAMRDWRRLMDLSEDELDTDGTVTARLLNLADNDDKMYYALILFRPRSIGCGICTPPNWSMIRLFWLGARR